MLETEKPTLSKEVKYNSGCMRRHALENQNETTQKANDTVWVIDYTWLGTKYSIVASMFAAFKVLKVQYSTVNMFTGKTNNVLKFLLTYAGI